jgi:Lipopolysaccharide-assembly
VRNLLVITLALALAGCGHVTPHRRTLPERIQTIYLAMPRNDSMEYGFEEDLARRLHEEFMADGRLHAIRAQAADIRLDTTIRQFSRIPLSFNADNYPIFEEASISALLTLWEPGREEPLLETTVTASTGFLSDPRRNQYVPEAEWRADLLVNLAQEIVHTVLTHRVEEDEEDSASPPVLDLDRDEGQIVPSIRTAPARR